MISRQTTFAAAAVLSLLALGFDAPMVFYWSRVQFRKAKYEPTEFVFHELKPARTRLAGQRLLAYGFVDGKVETFSLWRDFGRQAFFEGKPTEEKGIFITTHQRRISAFMGGRFGL